MNRSEIYRTRVDSIVEVYRKQCRIVDRYRTALEEIVRLYEEEDIHDSACIEDKMVDVAEKALEDES